VVLVGSDNATQMFITVGKAQSADISQDLSADIQGVAKNLTDLQVGQGGQPGAIQGQNFQQELVVRYQATISTQQGTTPVFGAFGELLNPSTGESAFIDLNGTSSAALKAISNDADSMINSMS
jgi:hypothetical protein